MPRVPITLTRSVLREVLRWYAAGLALFLILQFFDLLSGAVAALLNYHATPLEALAVFGSRAPMFLNRALVLAVPFALLLTFGRMQGDSELKAVFAAGVRPLGLVWPLALPFLLVGALAYFNAGYLTPAGLANWEPLWKRIYHDVPTVPSQDNYTFASGNALFYAGRVTGGGASEVAQLQGVLVQRGEETITAPTGTWNTRQQTWTVQGAWITRPGQDPQPARGALVFPQRDTLEPPGQKAEQVSTPALRARLAGGRGTPEEVRADRFELVRRVADPLTPVVFALAAGTLGLMLRNRAVGFAATVVFIVAFYVLYFSVPPLARVGALAPALAAWLPNLVFLAVAAGLAWRLR